MPELAPAAAAAPAAEAAPAARAYTAADVMHEIVDEAPPGAPLDITASLPPAAGWQAIVYYRTAGAAAFTPLPMRPRYRELVARIPAAAVHGASLQYYVEVRDATSAVVTRIGRASSPNLVAIDAEATPHYYPDQLQGTAIGPDLDNPLALQPVAAPIGPEGGALPVRTRTWVATGVALGTLAGAIGFHIAASQTAANVEAEAARGESVNCTGGPPCRIYDAELARLASRGETCETLATISAGVGIAAVGVAAVLWYQDLRSHRGEAPRAAIAPLIDGTAIGGSAVVRF
jgi:hypothetical protein